MRGKGHWMEDGRVGERWQEVFSIFIHLIKADLSTPIWSRKSPSWAYAFLLHQHTLRRSIQFYVPFI